jgi:hypothetical protein
MIRTSRSHPSDVSQRSPRPSMSCLPPETNKQKQPRGRTESVLRLCLSRVIRTVRWSDHRYLAVGWDSQLRWSPCKYCPSPQLLCCCCSFSRSCELLTRQQLSRAFAYQEVTLRKFHSSEIGVCVFAVEGAFSGFL